MILTQVIDALIDCKTSINNQQWTDLQAHSDRLKPLGISVGRDSEVVNHYHFLLSIATPQIEGSVNDIKSDMLIIMDQIKKLEQQSINLNAKITTKKKKVKK